MRGYLRKIVEGEGFLKIVFVGPAGAMVPSRFGGAVETWIEEVSALLEKRGHEVAVVSDVVEGVVPESTRKYKYVRGVGKGIARIYSFALLAGLKAASLGADVVHLHAIEAAAPVVKFFSPKSRLLASVHNLPTSRMAAFPGTRFYYSFCDGVHAISNFVSGDLNRRLGIPESKLSVVFNGVDLESFKPNASARLRARLELGVEGGEFLVSFFGRVMPEKGVGVFLAAVESLGSKKIRGLVVGPPGFGEQGNSAHFDEMKKRARASGAIFFGPVFSGSMEGDKKKIAQLMNASDVVVVPSLWEEPLGLVALEAQACGVPVIASSSGGLPEIVLDSKTGFLVPAGDGKAIAEKILFLSGNAKARSAFGKAARKNAENFSWERAAMEIEALYLRVASPR